MVGRNFVRRRRASAIQYVTLLQEPVQWEANFAQSAGDAMPFTSNDACLLIQKLEEIHIGVTQGCGDDYLTVLSRIVKGGERHALQRLQTVRLSLARYYARCATIGVGGRSSGWNY